ncbi:MULTISPECIES: MFS transporter [Dietzia]|uniref:MFS transporter n=1 Tax=Dietzia cinnamea TaxID=321318 RepID=A0AAW5Q716_9ACTN|nr:MULTISPECIES: MFS transporter [Dietzia]MCT1863372.1 MFS transporter [Dietzia cinnamea]MCT2029399.1 MFS transporter [Dietzia cinnamea]MCT2033104.1 MFS transporter [Dietzia cinnamea]MCT2061105.1 MFS transporter [Dietzia cinnamea]MCT2076512.1 MFS transporter [Dietzia cinnamea]
MWDWGSAAFNAVIVTFVFSVYLTDSVGADLDGPLSAATWLSISVAVAGLVIALTAPVMGQRADRGGRRRRSLAIWTYATVLLTALMFLVDADAPYPWFFIGLALLAIGSITFEFAEVSYFAMLRQVSTPATVGRVSGFGWAMGYFGGIFLLLGAFLGFIAGDGPDRGLLGVTTDGGMNVRLVCLLAAVWFALFALPVLRAVPEHRPAAARGAAGEVDDDEPGFLASYRILWADLKRLWQRDPRTVKFLVASAIFRDGLAGVFTFGAILAVTVYGLAPGDVLIFGVAANVVAASGAAAAGRVDDRVGPKAVIIGSLVAMIATMTVLLFVDGLDVFWVFGLLMCLFVGPAQSASRSFLARLAPAGSDGQMFGLYATTGRAVSFLAPALFGLFTWAFSADRAGIAGIGLVLLVGLLLLLPVRTPSRAEAESTWEDAKPAG